MDQEKNWGIHFYIKKRAGNDATTIGGCDWCQ